MSALKYMSFTDAWPYNSGGVGRRGEGREGRAAAARAAGGSTTPFRRGAGGHMARVENENPSYTRRTNSKRIIHWENYPRRKRIARSATHTHATRATW